MDNPTFIFLKQGLLSPHDSRGIGTDRAKSRKQRPEQGSDKAHRCRGRESERIRRPHAREQALHQPRSHIRECQPWHQPGQCQPGALDQHHPEDIALPRAQSQADTKLLLPHRDREREQTIYP
jgi:hypothetical protein